MTKTPMGFRAIAALFVALTAAACSDPQVKKAKHVEAGDRLFAEKQYKQAILEYRNATKLDPRYGEARWKLAQAFEADQRVPEAIREYLRAAELLPDRGDAQLRAAILVLAGKDFERARKYSEAALKIDPKNLAAHIVYAHSLAGLKDLDSALKEIEEAIQMSPEDSRGYTNLGALRIVEGNREKALAAFQRAIEVDPRAVSARLALAYYQWSTGSAEAAETQFKEALALDPKHPTANRMLALFYLGSNRSKDAEAPLRTMVETGDSGSTLTLADLYTRTGRADQARPLYETLRKDKLYRATVVTRLAGIDGAAGQYDKAYAALEEELKRQPSNIDLLLMKARLLLSQTRLPEAEQVAAAAVDANKDSAAAHYLLGRAQAARAKNEEAIKSFNEAIRLNPRATAPELQLAQLMLVTGKADAALRHAERVRKVEPANYEARVAIATSLIGKRELTKADVEVQSLVKDFPQSATAHALQGTLAVLRRDGPGALRAFDRALQLDPENLHALAGRVSIDLQLKRPAEGRARLARALEQKPKDAGVLVLAARFEGSMGDTAAAERYLRRAIEANPTLIEAYSMLGGLLMRQRRLDEARAEFQLLAERAHDPTSAKTMVGVIFDIQKRSEESRKIYEEVVRATSRAPVAANNLAWNYADKGENLDYALQLAQQAKAQLPDRHEVDDTLGWVYFKKNMVELAIPPLERSVKKDPSNYLYHYHLGLAYAKAGRKELARRALEEALKLKPDFPGRSEAETTLAALKG